MFWHLLKKDWQESTFRFLLNASLIVVIFALLYYFIERQTPFAFLLSIPLVFLHLFYMFFSIIFSLRKEWKERTVYFWFNMPIAGWKLLLSKFTVAYFQFAISLLITMFMISFLFERAMNQLPETFSEEVFLVLEVLQALLREFAPVIFLFISQGAIQIGLAGLFIYVMSKVIKPLGWLIGIIITFIFNYIYSWFTDTAVYSAITSWGEIFRLGDLPEHLLLQMNLEGVDPVIMKTPIYAGYFLVEVVIIILIFWAISWLFDRKVQI
ncbi:hypothetical protein LGQ02_11845 [Bacillus shivajii]|uniref:hypothetical protein n=1 Tax=Bacillus shivajii TaxID=1983719 RepID=UPI001CF9D499|nr:hypothetical protein [Bacillus shivajii]UCZ51562.1 hypothetical protein LGQ02_11845 [Bacillus shivajii]